MMGTMKAILVSDVRNARTVLSVIPSPNFGGGFPSHLHSKMMMASASSVNLHKASYHVSSTYL